jgi:hypothetical protein
MRKRRGISHSTSRFTAQKASGRYRPASNKRGCTPHSKNAAKRGKGSGTWIRSDGFLFVTREK